MQKHTFLIEFGTDELPPKILKKLGKDLSNHIKHKFKENNINYDSINWFAAPRHLAVKAKISIPKKTLSSICNHNFIDHPDNTKLLYIDTIKEINSYKFTNHNPKQPYKTYQKNLSQKDDIYHQNLKKLLLKIIKQSLEKLVNYKMMRWSNIRTPFIRPVKTVTMLLDSSLISGRIFEINIDRTLYGHRYIQHNRITINHADDYPNILIKKGHVMVDYYMRKHTLKVNIENQASKLGGVIDIRDDYFLEEITASIEWPVVLSGRFDKKFLTLPPEVITHIMKKNQKYFPVYNIIDGMLLPCFIFIVNTITNDYKKIIIGHENIIKTRFSDAEFFLKNDSKHRLEEYIPKLDSILFHNKLGSIRDKVNRITVLSEWIASQIDEDITQAKRAGHLCKCDLASDMVHEFPDLQGIIGMHYARRDGESEKIALAQKEHYQPIRISDTIPKGRISCIVSIADKIDTISGIFGIKKFPTNNKDPFALKRASIGILNIIIQQKLSLNLVNLIHKSVELYESRLTNTDDIKKNIYNFMYNRLRAHYCLQGYKLDIVESVLSIDFSNILVCEKRIKSIDNFCKLKKTEYDRIHLVYKRISNILKKQNILFDTKIINNFLLKKPEEIQLFSQIIKTKQKIASLLKQNHHYAMLVQIAQLSNSAHDFLDKIIILDNNLDIKINRLILLNTLKQLILKVIDVSVLKN